MKYLKKLSIFAFVFISCIYLQAGIAKASAETQAAIKAPVVTNANLINPYTRWGRPIVTGVTQKDADVLVYVDGKFAGMAKVNDSETETNNFYFQPALPLAQGDHTIYVVARDKETRNLSAKSAEKTVIVSSLVAPTVYKPNEDTKTGNNRPLISGLTKSGTRVLIYIDGVYNGKTEIVKHESGVAGFVYKPFLHLSVGSHKYFAIAETVDGKRGMQSRVVSFNIERKFPAPTLLTFKDGNKARLTGLAKNNSRIQIYLDKKLQGEFKVKNDESGTANFYFNFKKPLTNGRHMVYAIAIDQRGKESIWSNVKSLNHVVVVVRKPIITKNAVSESVTKKDQVKTVDKNVVSGTIKADDKTVKAENNKDNILNKILSTTTPEVKATGTGIVDEESNSQSKVRLNLIIFVLFLLALVGWIFWVNRELIKEKTEKEQLDGDKSSESEIDKK